MSVTTTGCWSVWLSDGKSPPHRLLTDHATGSHAWLTSADGHALTVTQHGPARIWDQIEAALTQWDVAGRPSQDQFTLQITQDAQSVMLDSGAIRLSWPLPAPPPR
jgi:hypothetical protein